MQLNPKFKENAMSQSKHTFHFTNLPLLPTSPREFESEYVVRTPESNARGDIVNMNIGTVAKVSNAPVIKLPWIVVGGPPATSAGAATRPACYFGRRCDAAEALATSYEKTMARLHRENYPNGCGPTWSHMCEDCCTRLGESETRKAERAAGRVEAVAIINGMERKAERAAGRVEAVAIINGMERKAGRSTEDVAKAFLTYAFRDVHFDYTQLTPAEKALCTHEEFMKLVAWVSPGTDEFHPIG